MCYVFKGSFFMFLSLVCFENLGGWRASRFCYMRIRYLGMLSKGDVPFFIFFVVSQLFSTFAQETRVKS